MPPATRSDEREEERRLNMRTLAIASAASATAAAVTSQLWIAGTWIAAAVTPVLVTLISEALHRPTERVARAWTAEGAPLGPRGRSRRAEPPGAAADRAPGAEGKRLPAGGPPVGSTPGPVRVYRQPASRPVAGRRRMALGVVAATAAIAFVIGVVALTTVDLVSGGSVGKGSGRSTLFGGGGGNGTSDERDAERESPDRDGGGDGGEQRPEQPSRRQPPTSTRPTQTTTTPPSDTAPAPAPTQPPPGEPAPGTSP